MHPQVLHDWSDSYCIKILTHLRKVAIPGETKLVLLEVLVPLLCRREPASSHSTRDVPGVHVPEAPEPLLPNFGAVNELIYASDLMVCIPLLSLFNLHSAPTLFL
jgi:hypothetical protein